VADALEPLGLHHRQIRIGDVPAIGRDLVLHDPVLHRWAVNSRPPHTITETHIQFVRDVRREVLDVGVPLAVVRGGEKQLRVIVQEHKPHIVEGGDPVRVEVAVRQLQQTAEPLRSTFHQRQKNGEL
jgi:hypothetical protein